MLERRDEEPPKGLLGFGLFLVLGVFFWFVFWGLVGFFRGLLFCLFSDVLGSLY